MAALVNSDIQMIGDLTLGALIEETPVFDSMASKFSVDQVVEDDVVKVATYVAADAADEFDSSTNNYETASTDTVTMKDVTLSHRIKNTIAITDVQRPRIEIEQLIGNHVQSIVKKMQIVIMNLITNANYSTAGKVSTAVNFDSDDVADLWGVAEAANYGKDRYLVLGTTYLTNMLKDNDLKNWQNSNTDDILKRANFPMINGFKIILNKYVPDNSENLVGYITDKSGIAVASGLIYPQDGSENTVDYQVITDPATGLSLMQRAHYAGATGTLYVTHECMFGASVGQAAGLDRITSS